MKNRLTFKLPATIVAGSFFFAGLLSGAVAPAVSVTVHNDLAIARPSETVELTAKQLEPLGDLTKVHVFEKTTGREVLAQSLDLDGDLKPESLVFQADVPPNGEKTFELRAGEKRVYRKEDFRVYGRFVRERFDDFAWENDRTAHRMYGAALETWEHEPLTSSSVDIWLKRTRRLVVNDWYMVDDYHRDHGEGADFYSAGRSRGCGGSGIWGGKGLVVSKNFRDSRVLANGPIRLVFELSYPVWEPAGVTQSEVKRITLDAGQNFSKFESRYVTANPADLQVGVGIKKFKDASFRIERSAGWFRAWDAVANGKGEFGCAVVFAQPARVTDVAEADGNQLMIARTTDSRLRYFAGAGWTESGDFPTVAEWDRYVEQWAQRVASPLRVEVSIK